MRVVVPIRAAASEWMRQARRVARHPVRDPELPPFTGLAAPMFALLTLLPAGVLLAYADAAALLDPRLLVFGAAILLTEGARIQISSGRELILNDLFYLVPFVFFPVGHSAALVLLVIGIGSLIRPRPLVRTLAVLSSSLLMRGLALAGVQLGLLLAGGEGTTAITAGIVAGYTAIQLNDYLVFPATIHVALGARFSWREHYAIVLPLDRFATPIELPLALAAAFAYPAGWYVVIAMVVPYLAAWRMSLLRPQLEELVRADRLKTEFLAMASHELRTPLTSIQGFASTLVDRWEELGDDQKLRFIGVIEEQGLRLGRLVDGLLTMSRIEAGALETRLERVGCAAVLERALPQFASRDVTWSCPADAAVVADPDHLEQILINYVGNALKYGAPPVRVEVEQGDGWVELRVRDDGPGVPEDFVPRLFDRFSQASEGLRRSSSGTGLGLSIARALAEAQGAATWYEPNVPCGACFVVRLRAAEREGPGQAADPAADRESVPAR